MFRLHNNPRIDELINGRTPVKQVINLAEPSNTFLPHTHYNEEVFLYYCNHRWNPEWAGETIIYAEHDYEAEHAITFKACLSVVVETWGHAQLTPTLVKRPLNTDLPLPRFLLVSKKPVRTRRNTEEESVPPRSAEHVFLNKTKRRAAFVV